MSNIETEHLGYAIRYAENEDVWRCEALSLDAKTLSALKSKMGKSLADARRVDPIPVLILNSYSGPAYKTAFMVLPDADGGKVWCMVDGGTEWYRGATRPVTKRELHAYKDLVLDTPDARAVLAQLRQDWQAHNENGKALSARRDALPRVKPL